ncbi:MAG: ECF transporter S component [Tyzzerella sp.]|nr:ECF transporter S component [Tyzzerella sp.]
MKTKLRAREITIIGMLGAIAVVLMLFEIPLPFAPSFYEIDFSEVPVLVGCFALGPVAGVLIELVKIVLNFLINGTATAGVGELANFVIGCSFCVPAGLIYRRKKTKKAAIVGLVSGTLIMAFLGCFINAYIMLPAYAKAFKLPIDTLIAMGSEVNAGITDLFSFVVMAVLPFNLLKGVLVSIIVLLIYKKISPILKKQY